MNEWKPIETAPEEGDFLVYMPTDERLPIQAAHWSKNCKVIGGHFHYDQEPVTHWMPFPAPPSNE